MESKEGDAYQYGAYFNRSKHNIHLPVKMVKLTMFLYYRNKPVGEKGINSNFVEIKNSTVILFNRLLSTNQAPFKSS